MKVPFLIGRLVFGGFFLYNGINHFRNRRPLSQYAGAKHVPQPEAAVMVSGAALLIGGTSILLGIKPKLGAAAIIGFLAGVSPMIHDFWHAQDPGQRQNDMIHFMKNIALLGAAVALASVEEPWPASVPMPRGSSISAVTDKVQRTFEKVAA
ncbi:MAG TPA: DoxX family protein [Bryobacteraceae bacterium]|nr:DoxX family protein [Bryobacteraceae bacterium]